MKKKFVTVVFASALALLFTGCGGDAPSESGSTKVSPEKVEYIEDTQISDLFTDPDNFKGKYVKMSGRIFTSPEQSEGTIVLQAWHDVENSSNNFIVHCKATDQTFSEGDYIIADGKIDGAFEGENAFGGTVTAPLINASSIETLSYIDAVTPTIKEVVPENAIIEQNGVSLKVDKVEFAEKETRIYLTETNSSADKFSMWVYSIKIVQNGQQIEQNTTSASAYEGDYASLSTDILPNASSSGIIVFPAMDSSASFQIYAEGMSDNWETEFQPFVIDIAAQ